MATNFPSSADNFVNPAGTDSVNSPSHAAQHANVNDAVEAIQSYLLQNLPSSSTYIASAEKGEAGGVAELDQNAQIPISQLGNLIDGAPNALNTLNELAAALNDNENFAATITNQIASIQIPSNAGPTYKGILWGRQSAGNEGNNSVGYESLLNLTSGLGNTAFGSSTLRSTTTASNNTAIGSFSMYSGNGIENVAIGSGTLQNNQSGNQNTAVGSQSLYSNTTGFYNTSIGAGSMLSNTTGDRNVAVGNDSLRSNTDGFYNTAVGYNALTSNTSGNTNVAVGLASLRSNTVGVHNVASGPSSLTNNTVGNFNVAYGSNSLFYNLSGVGNVAYGYGSLQANIFGNYNTAIGHGAGQGCGTNNINNTYIGRGSNPSSTTSSNEVTIGNSEVNRFRIPGLGIDWTPSTAPKSINSSKIASFVKNPSVVETFPRYFCKEDVPSMTDPFYDNFGAPASLSNLSCFTVLEETMVSKIGMYCRQGQVEGVDGESNFRRFVLIEIDPETMSSVIVSITSTDATLGSQSNTYYSRNLTPTPIALSPNKVYAAGFASDYGGNGRIHWSGTSIQMSDIAASTAFWSEGSKLFPIGITYNIRPWMNPGTTLSYTTSYAFYMPYARLS